MEMVDWNSVEVGSQLGKIRKLKGVKDAALENHGLAIYTKNLRHKKSFLPLPQMRIHMPFSGNRCQGYNGGVSYSYERKSSRFHEHPVLKIRNNSAPCVGSNVQDYYFARKHGPHMAVIQQLAMLQTIKKP